MRGFATLTSSPRRGEGWDAGERGGAERAAYRSGGNPHPTSPKRRSRQGFVSFSRSGEGLAGAGVLEFEADLFEDASDVFSKVVVPEADHGVACGFDEASAFGIGSAVRVLAAVEFDYQLRLNTGEVHDVTADRELAAEFGALDLTAAEALPELRFDVGRISSQSPPHGRPSFLHRWNPSPNPLHVGEGYKVVSR